MKEFVLAITAIAVILGILGWAITQPYIEVYQSWETNECKYIRIDGVRHPCSDLKSGTYDEHIWVK